MGQGCPHGVENAIEIDGDAPPPDVIFHAVHGAFLIEPGACDDIIDLPEPGVAGFSGGCDRLWVGHIKGVSDKGGHVLQLARKRGQAARMQVGQKQVCARGGEQSGNSRRYAAAGPGQEQGPSGEIIGYRLTGHCWPHAVSGSSSAMIAARRAAGIGAFSPVWFTTMTKSWVELLQQPSASQVA